MTVDENLKVKIVQDNDMRWIDPLESEDITVYGFHWLKDEHEYIRLKKSDIESIKPVNPNVAWLAKNTSGGQLHFITNSRKLTISAKIKDNEMISRMTPVAQKGFDLYVGQSFETVRFHNATSFKPEENEYRYTFFENNNSIIHCIINFPLYAGVDEVLIGIEPDASIEPAKPFTDSERIVVYGTSITQGGCASRPGLSYTNQLSRKMKREFINLGFSGNAFGEPELMEVIADIHPVEMFIIDYEANSGTNGKLEKTLEDIIKIFRRKHPDASIVVVSRIPYLFDVLNENLGSRREEIRLFQQNMVEKFRSNGDKNIHYIDGSKFFEPDFDDFTIDSIHPNDMGFERIVKGLGPQISNILNNRSTQNE